MIPGLLGANYYYYYYYYLLYNNVYIILMCYSHWTRNDVLPANIFIARLLIVQGWYRVKTCTKRINIIRKSKLKTTT